MPLSMINALLHYSCFGLLLVTVIARFDRSNLLILVFFFDLLANTGGTTFGTAGSNGGFPFGAPSGPSSGGFNFGAAQAASVPSTFTFGASGGGGAPTFGANTGPSVAGNYFQLVWHLIFLRGRKS